MSDPISTEQPLKGPIDDAGDGQVVAETSARQGRRGLHMFAVLAISTVLAVIVMFGIWSTQAGKMNAAAHGPSQPKSAPNTPNP
jgi:hypothetical protein